MLYDISIMMEAMNHNKSFMNLSCISLAFKHGSGQSNRYLLSSPLAFYKTQLLYQKCLFILFIFAEVEHTSNSKGLSLFLNDLVFTDQKIMTRSILKHTVNSCL